MKKLLLSILSLVLMIVPMSANAQDNGFYFNGISGHVVGVCEMQQEELSSQYCANYNLVIDINSTIMFENPIDTLVISDAEEKGGDVFFDFADGQNISGDACTVTYSTAVRNDSSSYNDLEVDLENEVEYINEGASVRFNKAGQYFLDVTLGASDGYQRVFQLIKTSFEGNEHYEAHEYYSQPMISFLVIVTDTTSSETVYNEYYDESIISVSGITNYDQSRIVMSDHVVAVCSAPVTITAQKDLSHIAVVKLKNVDGEWKEERFFDGHSVNLGDTTKNWYPADESANVYESCYEYTGNGDFSDEHALVKKGTSISFSEKGMYTVWAETSPEEFTGLTFEIADSVAKYTSSKVLVDGKEVKFEAYNINDNNYFKLRDIAFALTKYGQQGRGFNVKWDGERNMINLMSGTDYEAVGGELADGDGNSKPFTISTSALLKDGKNVSLKAFLINGNNYFKLRDLGKLFDFNVSWDGKNNCILIDSTTSYIDE